MRSSRGQRCTSGSRTQAEGVGSRHFPDASCSSAGGGSESCRWMVSGGRSHSLGWALGGPARLLAPLTSDRAGGGPIHSLMARGVPDWDP